MTYEEAIEILEEEIGYPQLPKYLREAFKISIECIEKQIRKSQRQILCRKRIKAMAYKEFAEKLKEKSFKAIRNYGIITNVVKVSDVDKLLKEMDCEEINV